MRNKRIINAYNSINPDLTDKQRILDAILAEAKMEETPKNPHKTRESVVYTRRQSTRTTHKGIWSTVAAAAALFLVAGFGLAFLLNRAPADPVYVEPTMEAIGEKTAADHYAPILEKYRRAIIEEWTKEQCEIEGISTRMQEGYDFSKVGYALKDLDDDGREELLIAAESVPHIDNIWDLYTILEDGTPIQLWVDEQDGGQCRLYEGNVISISDSRKHELDLTFYNVESGRLVMREMLQWEDEDTVFYKDANGNTRQVTAKEGQNIGNTYDIQKLELTLLADLQVYLPDADTVEKYTPILEKYRMALTEHWSRAQCFEHDISAMAASNPEDNHNLGWCLLDIDSNGIEELIIGYGDTVVDLYSIKPDNIRSEEMIKYHGDEEYALPVENGICHLAKSEGAIQYTLCEDGSVVYQIVYENGTSWCYYKVQPWGLELQNVLMYRSQNEGNNAYSYGPNEDKQTYISKEEAGNIIVGHQSMKLQVKPIVEPKPVTTDISARYQSLIELYTKAIRENWHPATCMEKGLSLMVAHRGEYYDDLGYAMIDMDGNGIDELIVTDGTNIYDLYTIIQDEETGPLHLISAMERLNYYLIQDNHIFYQGSGGAARQVYCHYALEDRELTLLEGYAFDADTDPDNPWFFHDGEEYGDPCGSFDPQPIIDAYEIAQIPFTPFR